MFLSKVPFVYVNSDAIRFILMWNRSAGTKVGLSLPEFRAVGDGKAAILRVTTDK